MKAVRRTSKKRQAIFDALCRSKAHPSAEQVYNELKPSFPDLSLGTVYRNLGVLIDDGLIISVGNVGGEERYDADTSRHPHFICSCCGKVLDLCLDIDLSCCCQSVSESICADVRSYALNFYGLCNDCKIRR